VNAAKTRARSRAARGKEADVIGRDDPALEAALVKKLKLMDATSAAGADGLHPNHLKLMVRTKVGRSQLIPALARLCRREFENPDSLPELWFKLMGVGNLSAIGEEKLRPIAVVSVLRRWFAGVWCAIRLPELGPELLEDGQLGVGVSRGVEIASMSASLAHEMGFWMVGIDLKNAFNSVFRAAILDGLEEICPELVPYFIRLYCESAPRLFFRRTDTGELQFVFSCVGAQQGDPLGPFFFCVGIMAALRRFRSRHTKAGSGRDLSAYIDDMRLFFTKLDEKALEAMKELLEALAAVGLEANESKTVVVKPAGREATSEELQLLASNGLVVSRGALVTGVPIGNEEFCNEFLSGSLERMEFDSLARQLAKMDKQVALQLLSKCLVTKVGYLARNLPPATVRGFLVQADATAQWVLEEILELPGRARAEDFFASKERHLLLKLPLLQALQVKLRKKDGGLQLRDNVSENGGAHTGSYVDNMAVIIPRLREQWPEASRSDAMEQLAMSPAISKILQAVRELVEVEGVTRASLSPTVPVEVVRAALDRNPEYQDNQQAVAVVAEARRRVDLLFGAVLDGSHRSTQRRLHDLVKKMRLKRFTSEMERPPEELGQQLAAGDWFPEALDARWGRALSTTGPVAGAFLDALAAPPTKIRGPIFRRILRLRLGLNEVVAPGMRSCSFPGCDFYGVLHAGHCINCMNGQQTVVHSKAVGGVWSELVRCGVNLDRNKDYESHDPFSHLPTIAGRGQKIEIVLPQGALSRVQPPSAAVETDLAYHQRVDPHQGRPIQTDFRTQRVCIDITITSPTTGANLRVVGGLSSAVRKGVSAARAAKTKVRYIPLGDGFTLRTFAGESFGLFGKQAMHLMEKFAEQATANHTGRDEDEVRESKNVYLRRVWQRMSVVLHTAVAEKVEDWILRWQSVGVRRGAARSGVG
jgi:hypothetical protein